jgi:hypothetical protein
MLEWDSDGDSEAGYLNAAGSPAQASKNLNAPGTWLIHNGEC